MTRKRLGEILLERGVIDVDQLNVALAHHRQWGKRLGVSLVEKNFVSEGTITRVLSEVMQIPMVDLAKVVIEPEAVRLLKSSTCEEFDIFPIATREHKGRRTLLLAMVDPLNVAAIDEVAFTTDMTVRPAIAQISSLRAAVDRYYHNQRNEIPPLDLGGKKKPAAPRPRQTVARTPAPEDGGQMTIIRAGVESVVDTTGEMKVVDLTSIADGEPIQDELPARTPLPFQPPPGYNPYAPEPSMPNAAPPPTAPQASPQYPIDAFQGQPTGAYVMAVPNPAATTAPPPVAAPRPPVANIAGVEMKDVEALERNFWALMRVLAKKGIITREEFLAELQD